MFNRKYFSLIVFSFTFPAQILLSQIVLQGTVSDNGAEYLGSGADPVAGALVTITDQADAGRTISSYTDQQGHYWIEIIQTAVESDPGVMPGSFRLIQNYPNPFNPSTVIGYELSQPARIVIEIYNATGQKVKTLVNGFHNTSGHVTWDGTNDMGQGVPAGLYIYSLKSGGKKVNRKMLLIDGHQGSSSASSSPSFGQKHADNTVLHKQQSDQYTLTVTGDNLATYEQQGLEITSNMTVDVTVTRAVTDIDGNVYTTVKIGNQWWMAQNLKVTHYRNGDSIPHVTDAAEWANLTTDAYSNTANDTSNVATYGRLYNWYAVSDLRNVAPAGWHVPTDAEWKELEMYLGMSQSDADGYGFRGTDEGGKLKETGTTHWSSPNTGATNESGFSALPGGDRHDDGNFYYMGSRIYFWLSTEHDNSQALFRSLRYNQSAIDRLTKYKHYGFSVRLLRD